MHKKILIVIFFVLICSSNVFAVDLLKSDETIAKEHKKEIEQRKQELVEEENEALFKSIDDAFGGFKEQLEKVVKLLSKRPKDYNPEMWKMAEKMFDAMLPVGMSLIALFFVIEFLANSYQFEKFRWETLLKILVKLFIMKEILQNIKKLLILIFDIVGNIISVAGGLGAVKNPAPDIKAAVATELTKMDTIDKLIFSMSLQPWILVLKGIQIAIMVILWGRFIEIYIYTAIAPIPLSTLMTEQLNSTGKRFLQNYIAVCFQGVIIVVGCLMYGAMMEQAADTLSSWTVIKANLVTSVVLLFVVLKSGSWAKQVTGAM